VLKNAKKSRSLRSYLFIFYFITTVSGGLRVSLLGGCRKTFLWFYNDFGAKESD
jgi:hypothetical protein